MLKIQRLLLIAPTEMIRTPAFERAQALANATGAMLHIVAFDYVNALAVAGLFDHDAMAQAREGYLQVHRYWLEQQARLERCKGGHVTTEVVWARLSPAHVLEYVNDFHPDLVIKDVQRVPALDRVFHRPLDWLLLRDCPAPLHLVSRAENPKPLKILAAIDLSHLEALTQGLNERVLDLASTLATSCGATLHLLNVSNWSVVGDAVTSVPTSSLDASLRDAVNDAQQEAFDLLAERYGIEEGRRHLLAGIPHQAIEHFARRNAFDMVVLGTACRHGVEMFVGSTAERLLRHAPCSLMLVKPPVEAG
ncbi:universal stress protein [Pseudomonas chlororaphis]|uniref:universal stress protein n=1 Tax=Pseudomonas chlororaphis TaxID=587753 RepID=UPI0006A5802C|nr:universal stress protein [Pseudomonas chlororaphis]AZD02331.1 Universal stress protein family 5 [Pseudomonas chlororaphis subsp. chlororaphis]MBM0280386.1 universal stress protein [Pseudomonas chlororaphis]MDO1504974.1 universal stress protein [Pseudomonas chlororaphis]ORM44864.1 universal stress protein UspA [Pseudomonas chlororaphis subsp. chlororaphis]TWR96093.1 universal stress protein UspA [Pseudomonas chlororaphis subsp. chlororaphis]